MVGTEPRIHTWERRHPGRIPWVVTLSPKFRPKEQNSSYSCLKSQGEGGEEHSWAPTLCLHFRDSITQPLYQLSSVRCGWDCFAFLVSVMLPYRCRMRTLVLSRVPICLTKDYIFFFQWPYLQHKRFLGQGLNPRHSCYLHCRCGNIRSFNPPPWAGDWTCSSKATWATAVRFLTCGATAGTPLTTTFKGSVAIRCSCKTKPRLMKYKENHCVRFLEKLFKTKADSWGGLLGPFLLFSCFLPGTQLWWLKCQPTSWIIKATLKMEICA